MVGLCDLFSMYTSKVNCLPTCGKHALNKVLDVAQDDSKSFRITRALRSKWLDLDTLAYWHWEVPLNSVGIVEDSTGYDQ
jgi:hypothetical protein